MAELSFRKRWITCYPDVLGNLESEEPFSVRVRRLSKAELDAFGDDEEEVRKAWKDVTPERLAQLFDDRLRGPFGPLTVDGERIAEGELGQLLELAAQEYLSPSCIYMTLVRAVFAANRWSEAAEGNCARRRGESGGTPRTAPAAATPEGSPAGGADASSTAASTS